ncbi:microtubule organization protein AKNA isoform X2 [Cuculus canorus]|uniref:microtubule organization protein AKNA isoform X2 n=1 Tax=Cuculus canorus TaxID=55661 RepID=UPI0023AB37CA|nr:microtubule organization protein AKNA isoform X2 [Cuculus canorus]
MLMRRWPRPPPAAPSYCPAGPGAEPGAGSPGAPPPCSKEVPSPPLQGHEAAQVTETPCPRAMASPAPWLRWTQTELTRWEGEEEDEEEEEEEDDNFERRMDEDGVIGLGEDAGSPPWGDGEDLEEGSLVEKEGQWHPQQDLVEEDEERGSSGGDEGPWGAESDGDPYAELSYEGRWGSESSGSPKMLQDGRTLCQPRGCSTDGGDTSGLSDASPGPATPSHQGWGTAGDNSGGHGQGWTPNQSVLLHLSPNNLRGVTSVEPVTKPQPAGIGLPGSAGLAPTGEPWGAGTLSAPQQRDRSRVSKKAVPTLLQPKPGQKSPSLSSRWRSTNGKEMKDPLGSGTGTADGTQYGRGRLNHPLPDLSKVEARVKFNQSYRPPRGRELPACPRATGGPIGFKSPAEIVREVLLSSGEGVPPQPPTSTALPQEFRSPKQATALVQQLQDDYHKLLTKYAEAENTIDQLRLGARVSLYADPPRPSRSFTMGTVPTGCRVMSLSIPRANTAALSTATASPSSSGGAPGPSERGESSSSPQPEGGCPTCLGRCCCGGTGTQVTQTLAGQTRKLQAQVEALEGWMRARIPAPQEQLQVCPPHQSPPPQGCTAELGVPGSGGRAAGSAVAAVVSQRFWKLKEAQDALERAYLQARQQHPDTSGDFDPDRTVEGEIFHLGLRLETLKEQLEPGAGQQPPLQPPAQPRSPPAPSPPPDTPSLHPESPAPMEGPQGTVGDNEAEMEGLPRPLWCKQLRVEEDFGDLLAQYKHFKSLPESLSLEQLSLAGSRSLEELDGPVAGDDDPSKVPCRTRSLEEGADLEMSSLHTLERRAAPLSPKELPWPEGTHLSPSTTRELPATAKPPVGLSEPPRAPLSHHSSGAGSTAPQHRPHKEQRIVSPETDSGFVGSEASRVSPPVHTPEHRPPSNATPGSLGPSIPIRATLHHPRKKEVTPLPSKPVLMGIYPTDGQGGMGESRCPPCSPPRWAESGGSEVGPNGDGSHTDSEVKGRSCPSGHPTTMGRSPASPPPAPETPSPTPPSPNPAHWDLLGSRLQRDQAIRALRDEVWQLRRSLEESLRRSRSYPEGKGTPRATLARRQPVASRLSSPRDAAPSGVLSSPARGRAAPRIAAARKGRSASLPRDRMELDMTTESDPSPARTWATPFPQRSPGSTPAAVTVRGQYTGTRYQAGTPHAAQAPREEPGTPGCPRCHRSRTPTTNSRPGDTMKQPHHSTPRRTRCPACQAPMGAPGSRDGATHEHVPGVTSSPGSCIDPQAEKPEQPGFWYLAASPAATAAIGCLAPVPLVPYAPSVLYCSPAVPTSAPAVAGVPSRHAAGHRRAEHPRRPHADGHHHCLALDELEDLNQSLSRAVEVAQSMRVTTTRMSRVLATELSRAQDLRGSCLF